MAQLTLEVVTPEKRLLTTAADEVRAPGVMGGFGIRLNHAPFMTALEPGRLTFVLGGQEHHFAIGGGFLQVADNRVVVLADTAEPATEIDVERARRALADATEKLRSLREEDQAFAIESARVRRAVARIGIAAR
jgi:F-type H+-transporting ATPase subunit epsilon